MIRLLLSWGLLSCLFLRSASGHFQALHEPFRQGASPSSCRNTKKIQRKRSTRSLVSLPSARRNSFVRENPPTPKILALRFSVHQFRSNGLETGPECSAEAVHLQFTRYGDKVDVLPSETIIPANGSLSVNGETEAPFLPSRQMHRTQLFNFTEPVEVTHFRIVTPSTHSSIPCDPLNFSLEAVLVSAHSGKNGKWETAYESRGPYPLTSERFSPSPWFELFSSRPSAASAPKREDAPQSVTVLSEGNQTNRDREDVSVVSRVGRQSKREKRVESDHSASVSGCLPSQVRLIDWTYTGAVSSCCPRQSLLCSGCARFDETSGTCTKCKGGYSKRPDGTCVPCRDAPTFEKDTLQVNRYSSLACSALPDWNQVASVGACGQGSGECLSSASPFRDSALHCSSKGWRLCSSHEILSAVVPSFCGLSSSRVWSLTPCEGGHLTLSADGDVSTEALQCSKDEEAFRAPCCADISPPSVSAAIEEQRVMGGFSCQQYETQSFCADGAPKSADVFGALQRTRAESSGLAASDACCGCGGGLRESAPFAYVATTPLVLGRSIELIPNIRTASWYAASPDCGDLGLYNLSLDGETGRVFGTPPSDSGPFSIECTVSALSEGGAASFNGTLKFHVGLAAYPDQLQGAEVEGACASTAHGFAFSSGVDTRGVCGQSEPCSSDQTHGQAEAICASRGGRLCSLYEITALQIGKSTGCSNVNQTSFWAVNGRYDQEATLTCQPPFAKQRVRCCGDTTARLEQPLHRALQPVLRFTPSAETVISPVQAPDLSLTDFRLLCTPAVSWLTIDEISGQLNATFGVFDVGRRAGVTGVASLEPPSSLNTTTGVMDLTGVTSSVCTVSFTANTTEGEESSQTLRLLVTAEEEWASFSFPEIPEGRLALSLGATVEPASSPQPDPPTSEVNILPAPPLSFSVACTADGSGTDEPVVFDANTGEVRHYLGGGVLFTLDPAKGTIGGQTSSSGIELPSRLEGFDALELTCKVMGLMPSGAVVSSTLSVEVRSSVCWAEEHRSFEVKSTISSSSESACRDLCISKGNCGMYLMEDSSTCVLGRATGPHLMTLSASYKLIGRGKCRRDAELTDTPNKISEHLSITEANCQQLCADSSQCDGFDFRLSTPSEESRCRLFKQDPYYAQEDYTPIRCYIKVTTPVRTKVTDCSKQASCVTVRVTGQDWLSGVFCPQGWDREGEEFVYTRKPVGEEDLLILHPFVATREGQPGACGTPSTSSQYSFVIRKAATRGQNVPVEFTQSAAGPSSSSSSSWLSPLRGEIVTCLGGLSGSVEAEGNMGLPFDGSAQLVGAASESASGSTTPAFSIAFASRGCESPLRSLRASPKRGGVKESDNGEKGLGGEAKNEMKEKEEAEEEAAEEEATGETAPGPELIFKLDDPTTSVPWDFSLHPCDCFPPDFGVNPPVSADQLAMLPPDSKGTLRPPQVTLTEGAVVCGFDEVIDYSFTNDLTACRASCFANDDCAFFWLGTTGGTTVCRLYSSCESLRRESSVDPSDAPQGTLYGLPREDLCLVANPSACMATSKRRKFLTDIDDGLPVCIYESQLRACEIMRLLGQGGVQSCGDCLYNPAAVLETQKKPAPETFAAGTELKVQCWDERYAIIEKASNTAVESVSLTCVDGEWVDPSAALCKSDRLDEMRDALEGVSGVLDSQEEAAEAVRAFLECGSFSVGGDTEDVHLHGHWARMMKRRSSLVKRCTAAWHSGFSVLTRLEALLLSEGELVDRLLRDPLLPLRAVDSFLNYSGGRRGERGGDLVNGGEDLGSLSFPSIQPPTCAEVATSLGVRFVLSALQRFVLFDSSPPTERESEGGGARETAGEAVEERRKPGLNSTSAFDLTVEGEVLEQHVVSSATGRLLSLLRDSVLSMRLLQSKLISAEPREGEDFVNLPSLNDFRRMGKLAKKIAAKVKMLEAELLVPGSVSPGRAEEEDLQLLQRRGGNEGDREKEKEDSLPIMTPRMRAWMERGLQHLSLIQCM
uniref:Apple domain-containing protein n=1 Tax=Chromera velia CCMP2878 TaxID=1169474 RepID=A0A0G4HGC9_9ALVE|eukprot:Cvel_27174.t1-p1 / transcript=Cvel_27174.t1 / gene=Cvel_27174 / organism=Chromera_velia_CCMP2878 / gene_product=hypothetical protein / transcript_product=hypothetical protein / location=Cvel_scaffold3349:2544-11679(-) / protein_length=1989 / sequence_SO=supercontig / SO=protein_coding / is_pseudo=false